MAGGTGTILHPPTISASKQLLPIYDKPMIYYPLTTLIQGGVEDILIITNPHNVWAYRELFKDAYEVGINIEVRMQEEAGGIPQAFTIGADFIGDDDVWLILGDNFFYGDVFNQTKINYEDKATVFAYYVANPEAYGVLEFDSDSAVSGVIEKPKEFVSHWAVTGLYHYPNDVVELTKTLKPSDRGELEITDINQYYCQRNRMDVVFLPRESIWLDAGTHEALADATSFVRTVESRTGFKIGSYQEEAHKRFRKCSGIQNKVQ